MLFRFPTSSSFVECNTLISLGPFPLHVTTSPWKYTMVHTISTSCSLQGNPGFTFIASCNYLSRILVRNTSDTSGFNNFPLSRGNTPYPFSSVLDSKTRVTWLKLSSSSACLGWKILIKPCLVKASEAFISFSSITMF